MLTLRAEYAAITEQQMVKANISFSRKREATTSNLEIMTIVEKSVVTKPAAHRKSLVTLSKSVCRPKGLLFRHSMINVYKMIMQHCKRRNISNQNI